MSTLDAVSHAWVTWPQAAAHRAVKAVKGRLNTELVEQATKSEAIKVFRCTLHKPQSHALLLIC